MSTTSHASHTSYARALARVLRFLWENHGAPKLDNHVRRYPGLRPRNVTATDDEREALLAAAPPHLRLFILLCSDLAIRSGTAARIAPEHYDSHRRRLTFTTKFGEKLSLPTTAGIETLLDDCDMQNPESFVRQLWYGKNGQRRPYKHAALTSSQHIQLVTSFRTLRLKLGITRHLTPHDLRRTTAVAMLRHTGDVRKVQALLGHRSLQATIWYLDHDLEPVDLETLEAIRLPFIIPRKDKTA